MTAERYVLGGRAFVPLTLNTLLHKLTVGEHIEAAGLAEPTLLPTEGLEAFTQRLIGSLMRSRRALQLVGCFLLPEDRTPAEWTPAMADETADFLGKLSDPADHQEFDSILAGLVLRFLESGVMSLMISRSSSPSTKAPFVGPNADSASGANSPI